MFDARKRGVRDLFLRTAGLVLLACCYLLVRWLLGASNLRDPQNPTPVQFAAAMFAFLCFSAGATLTAIGAHIFDQVEISQRWARLSYPPPKGEKRPSAPIFLVVPEDELSVARAVAAARDAQSRQFQHGWEAAGRHVRA